MRVERKLKTINILNDYKVSLNEREAKFLTDILTAWSDGRYPCGSQSLEFARELTNKLVDGRTKPMLF